MKPTQPPVLLVVAAPAEGKAVARATSYTGPLPEWRVCRISKELRLLVTGIGKANSAAATSRALCRGRYSAVINLGVAGALPGSGLAPGDAVAATLSVYADEGLETGEGFQTCSQMGFPLGPFEGNGVAPSGCVAAVLERVGASAGVIATVSTCSGTDELAAQVGRRTGAVAEAMEGAAVGHVAARFSDMYPVRAVGFGEARVISNTTGERTRQQWDLGLALRRLTELTERLAHQAGALRGGEGV